MNGRLAELKKRELSDVELENVSGGLVFAGLGYDNNNKPSQMSKGDVNGNKNPKNSGTGGYDPNGDPNVGRKPFGGNGVPS